MTENRTETRSISVYTPERIERIKESNKEAYGDLLRKYNKLVNAFNELSDEYALVNAFTQSAYECNPPDKGLLLKRSMPFALYSSSGKQKKVLGEALSDVIDFIGFEIILDSELDGSFFKRAVGLSKEVMSHEDMQKEILILKRHVENKTLGNSQADVDSKLAESVSLLLTATSEEESVLLFGSFVVVRCRNSEGELQTVVKTLSPEEQIVLSFEQSMLTSPNNFFANLQMRVNEYLTNQSSIGSEHPIVQTSHDS